MEVGVEHLNGPILTAEGWGEMAVNTASNLRLTAGRESRKPDGMERVECPPKFLRADFRSQASV